MKTQQPLVSFIIPYFNAGNTIQETIDSILNQSYTNYDIWIVNDGSTDEKSLEKLKELENLDRITVLHQENAGPSVARNLAIENIKGEFFVPIDGDDLIEENALVESIIHLKDNLELGAVYGNFTWFGAKRGVKKQSGFRLEKQFLMNQIAVTALIRKKMWNELGAYDTFLSKPGLEDWEFWLRVGLSDWKLKYLDIPFFKARVNEHSRTYKVANKNIDRIKKYVYEKHAIVLAEQYEKMYYQKKQLLETPDYRIGNNLMKPFRFFKSLLSNQ